MVFKYFLETNVTEVAFKIVFYENLIQKKYHSHYYSKDCDKLLNARHLEQFTQNTVIL